MKRQKKQVMAEVNGEQKNRAQRLACFLIFGFRIFRFSFLSSLCLCVSVVKLLIYHAIV